MEFQKTGKDVKKMTFEEAVEELESIATSLENANVPLENAVQLFERGSELRQFCDSKLKNAKLKVEKVIAENGKVSNLKTSELQEEYGE